MRGRQTGDRRPRWRHEKAAPNWPAQGGTASSASGRPQIPAQNDLDDRRCTLVSLSPGLAAVWCIICHDIDCKQHPE